MHSFIRVLLLFIAGFLCFYIIASTRGEYISSSIHAAVPTPTYRPFPLFTIRPLPSPTPTSIPLPPRTGFCLTVPVLMYHHIENLSQATRENHQQLTVDPGFFDDQMKYLVEHGYKSISAERLVTALENHETLEKSVVITLDDGYDDIYENAFPIAKKYGVILNLMIPTGLLENSGYLRWSQLQTMVSSGNVKLYNHTWSHASLPAYTEEKMISEITTAQTQLEEHFGIIPKIFTYPYGAYTPAVIALLQRLGYRGAMTTEDGTTQCSSTLFSIERTRVGNTPLSFYGI